MTAPPEDNDNSSVHLGFCEPVEHDDIAHTSPNWNNWDGGQVGGRPSWLNPRDLPKQSPLSCLRCNEERALRFICQLYAPADTVNSNAFHRSLYLFACPSCSSVRVLRTQLSRDNDFYPSECDTVPNDWNKHLSETHEVKLCKVCGQRGKGVCPLQQESFCGKQHQKEHKQYVFEKDRHPDRLPSVYPIYELVVEEEPPAKQNDDMEERDALFEHENDNDSDQDLEQDDLNRMTGARTTRKQDQVTDDFFERVERAKDQCIRYRQWHSESPLWTSSENLPSAIPDCPYCGAPRKFEFQLMPQLLHYLKPQSTCSTAEISQIQKDALIAASTIVEKADPNEVPAEFKETHEKAIESMQSKLLGSGKELDWGVVVVYTCAASCDGDNVNDELGAYREEYAWVQPSLA